MFQRILVPMDGTDRDTAALHLARHLAAQLDAHLVLVHIIPAQAHAGAATIETQIAALNAHVSTLRAQGVAAEAVIAFDQPAAGIASAAHTQHSDLIIMAPHPYHGMQALLAPQVTAQVTTQASTPLLIWPAQAPVTGPADAAHATEATAVPAEIASITDEAATAAEAALYSLLASPAALVIVPLDGSALAEGALHYATTLATAYGRGLLLVRVVPRVALLGAGAETRLLEAEAQQDENRKALRYLKLVRRYLIQQTPSLTVQTALRVGDPARELLRIAEAHPGSLLVLSTHGRGGLARFLLGSVATAVVRRATSPLLIVPAAVQARDFSVPNAIRRRPTRATTASQH